VRSRLHRARAKLQATLANDDPIDHSPVEANT
jgi:DNA-directed RNA polymerase specialized sigma24 family protein